LVAWCFIFSSTYKANDPGTALLAVGKVCQKTSPMAIRGNEEITPLRARPNCDSERATRQNPKTCGFKQGCQKYYSGIAQGSTFSGSCR
jgi:hypothetical protein